MTDSIMPEMRRLTQDRDLWARWSEAALPSLAAQRRKRKKKKSMLFFTSYKVNSVPVYVNSQGVYSLINSENIQVY